MHKIDVYRSSWLVFISAAGVALAFVLSGGMFVDPAAAGGGVIPVCNTCTHTSLASAVAAAGDGDTIEIQEESLLFLEPITITQDITITGIPTSSHLDLDFLDDYVFAIYITPTAEVVMQNLLFQSHYGGGIYNEGHLALNQVGLSGFTTQVGLSGFTTDDFGWLGREPMVIFSNNYLTVTNSYLNDNYLPAGGVIINEGVAYLENNIFENNDVPFLHQRETCPSSSIGRVIIGNDGTMVIKDSELLNNRLVSGLANNQPAEVETELCAHNAFFLTYGILNRGNLHITDSLFQGNNGEEDSPLIRSNDGLLLIENSAFEDNEYTTNVFVQGGQNTLTNNSFRNNDGTGIAIEKAEVELHNLNFEDNFFRHYGGLYIVSNPLASQVEVDDCLFSHNTTFPGRKSGSFGGAVYVGQNAQITFQNCIFEHNYIHSSSLEGDGDGLGGAIYNAGQTQIDSSLFQFNGTDNRGQGGAIYQSNHSGSTLWLTNSAVANNRSRYGAGIYSAGVITIENSSLTNNYYPLTGDDEGYGGGIFQTGGELYLVNSTISGNYFSQSTPPNQVVYGGGLYVQSGLSWLTHTTLVNNTGVDEGGGIYLQSGELTAVSSIVAGNEISDCSGTITSGGYNIFGVSTGCVGNGTTDGTVNPAEVFTSLLDTLQDNGGETLTHALLEESAALDVIPAGENGCGTTITQDQRGEPRPLNSGCDVGAFEGDTSIAHLYLWQVNPGLVEVSGENSCTAAYCPYVNTIGTAITLTATPTTGYTFAHWAGACAGSEPTCQLTLTQTQAITAVFEIATYPFTVTVSGPAGGSVTSGLGVCEATCTYEVAEGETITLTAVPTAGVTFSHWSGACSGSDLLCVLTVEQAAGVEAVFTEIVILPISHQVYLPLLLR